MLPLAMVREVSRVCVYVKSSGGICAISSMLWEEEEVGVASFSGHSVELGREEILTSSLN